jgi:hypothetical protein
MKIQHAFRQVPKPGSNTDQCEDAFDFSPGTRIATVSDGASTAFESRRWARLLARQFATNPPGEWSRDELLLWTSRAAETWKQSIPWHDLTLFEEEKASSGSAATLVALQFEPATGQADARTWRCLALGDSCLFQVREDQLVRALPVEHSADFNLHPSLLSTDAKTNAATLGRLVTSQGTWQSGDRFFLLTDAIAEWFLRKHEAGQAPWEFLSSTGRPAFESFVHEAQAHGQMRKDDVTVFMIGADVPVGTPGRRGVPAGAAGRPLAIPVPVGREPVNGGVPKDEGAPKPAGPQPGQPARELDPKENGRTGPTRPGHGRGRGQRKVMPRADPRTPRQPTGQRTPGQPPAGQRTPGRAAGQGTSRSRRRAGWIIAAGLIVCAAIGLGFGLAGSNGPPPPAPVPRIPAVQPTADDFAILLTNYSGRASGAAYDNYVSKLVGAAGNNSNLATQLIGPLPTAADKVTSSSAIVSTTVSSSQGKTTVYVIVKQKLADFFTIYPKGNCTKSVSCPKPVSSARKAARLLLIQLTMTWQDTKWLVSAAQTGVITSSPGVLTATTASGGTS